MKDNTKFLVVSYDDDQQQWFWDFVCAKSQEDAGALVCKRRPYVIAADAITPSELSFVARNLQIANPKILDKRFKKSTRDWRKQ